MAHRALVTSPLRGPGFDKLRRLVDVVYDPWLEQRPLRIYDADQLAERIDAEEATVLVVETDSVKGPVLERPLVAIASTRGDPNNVDIAGATAAKIPILNAPGRNADAVAEMAIALLFAVNRRVLVADRDGTALLSLTGLGAAPDGYDYEAWVVPPGSATPRPAGTFAGTERIVLLSRAAPPGSRVAVTLEADGGTERPTRPLRLVAERAP